MPQFDGQVVINTAISDAGLKEGGKDIEEAVKKMVKAVDGLSRSARIAMEKQGAAIVKANRAYRDQEAEVARLRAELDKLSNTQIQSQEYQNIGKQIETAEVKLNKLKDAQDKFISVGGSVSSPTFKRRQIEIEELRNTIKYAKAEQDQLLASGGAYQPVDTSEMAAKLQAAENKLGDMRGSLNMAFDSMSSKMDETGKKGEEAAGKIAGAFKTSGTVMVGAVRKTSSAFSDLEKRAIQAFSKMRKESGRNIKQLLKYTLGIRSLFVLFNRLRNYGSAAFKVLAADAEDVNSDLSKIKSNFSQFKNSIATGFQPIIHAITPFITSVINMFTQASTAVGTFFAALTGQKYIYKAKELNESFAESTEDAAKAQEKLNKSLAAYDKLDVISKQEDNASAAEQVADAFEKVPIDGSGIANIADMIKEAWKNADFSGLSEIIGVKLRNSLNSIPWDDIQNKANKTAGSISTMINGFVEVDGLGTSIGSNFAKLLNTMQQSLNTFLKETHWDSVGSFIADNIMGFATTFDGKLLGSNIAEKFNATAELISGFNSKMDWTKAGEFTSNIVNGFFGNVKPKELGKSISDLVVGLIDGINEFLTKTKWDKAGTAIGQFITSIDWDMILGGLANIFVNVIRGALKLIPALLKELASQPEFILDLGAILTIKLAVDAVKNAITTAIASALGGSLTTSSALTLNLPIPYIAITAGIVYFATKAIQRELPGQDEVETSTEAGEQHEIDKQKQLEEEEKKYNEYLDERIKKYSGYLKYLSKGTTIEKKALDIEQKMKDIAADKSISDERRAKLLNSEAQSLLYLYEYMIHDLEELEKQGKLNDKYLVSYDSNLNKVNARLKTFGELTPNIGTAAESFKHLNDKTNETKKSYQDFANTLKNNDSVLLNTADNIGVVAKEADDAATETDDLSKGLGRIPRNTEAKVGISVTGQSLVDLAKSTLDSLNTYSNNPAKPKTDLQVTGQDKVDTAKNSLTVLDITNAKPKADILVTGKDKVDEAKKSITDLQKRDNSISVEINPPKQNIISKTWNDACETIKKAINSGLIDPLNNLTITMANLGGGITSMFGGVSSSSGGQKIGANAHNNAPQTQKLFTIPKLATGAVIPPNREFLAVLGDQKNGTNIETPLSTMVEAFRMALDQRENTADKAPIELSINGRLLARAVWDEQDKRYRQVK